MALTTEQLQEIKNKQSGNKSEKVLRITLSGLLAKFAGKQPQFNELNNRDEIPFVLFWSNQNVKDFAEKTKQAGINPKQAKAWSDKLFRFSTDGSRVIYAQRQFPLPEEVTYDQNSAYDIIVDLMHASGSADGKPFETDFVRVQTVNPTMNKETREYVAFTPEEVKAIISNNNENVKQIEG